MRVKVSITDSHIQNGLQRKPSQCPIALSLGNLGFKKPTVGCETVLIDKDGKQYGGNLPRTARQFINRFDGQGREAVKPFSFNLNLKEVI